MAKVEHRSGRASAIALLLLTVSIWGSTFVVTKAVIGEMPPFLLALTRMVIASAFLLAISGPSLGLPLLPRPIPWARLALMGLTGVTIFYLGFNLALANTSASASALLQGAVPVFTALLAIPFLGERVGPRRWVGIVASLVGVAVVVLLGSGGGDAPHPLLGDLFMLMAVLAWCVYTIVGKRLEHVSALAVTTYSSVFGTIFLVPFGAYDLIVRPPTAINLAGWLGVVYLAIAAGALTSLLWNRALHVLDAGQVANFINLVPVLGVAAAAIFLGEPILPAQLAGGALVLFGVWLSSSG
jgi:drug/metabolite transporter (DMT)-like permease